ncbi:MAG: hypothetical protein ABEJ76_09745 [Halanaeroarchaeum sp.]
MRLPETRDLFARELEFPVTAGTIEDRIGETQLDAPTGQHETIAEVVERSSREEFGSADELYDTLVTFVSDAFIGRKYYDERGHSSQGTDEEVSF